MKTNVFINVENSESIGMDLQNGYISPYVEICNAVVEKGFSLSFSSGNGDGVSTDGSFGWDDEIEF